MSQSQRIQRSQYNYIRNNEDWILVKSFPNSQIWHLKKTICGWKFILGTDEYIFTKLRDAKATLKKLAQEQQHVY